VKLNLIILLRVGDVNRGDKFKGTYYSNPDSTTSIYIDNQL